VFYARKFIPQRYSLGDEGRDDRATVEAKPEDVGDKALIRVLDAQFRGSSGAVLCLRAGVDRLIGHKATSGIPLPWLRPRRYTIFVCPGLRSGLELLCQIHRCLLTSPVLPVR
jgi:hypothetical protein